MIRRFLALPLCLFAVACGTDSPRERASIVSIPLISDLPPASIYYLEDPGCADIDAKLSLTKTEIHRWDGFNVAADLTPLANIRSDGSLMSPAVTGTAYGRHYNRECDNSGNDGKPNCSDGAGGSKPWLRNGSENNPLRVCKDGHEYVRHSYEGVGLTSIYYIEKANARFREIRPDRLLKPIALEILPVFKTTFRNMRNDDGQRVDKESYIVNNLAYFPDNDLLVVFPEDKESAEKNKGHFWESAFVLAHEYGHHIEHNLIGNVLAASGLQWDPFKHRYLSTAYADGAPALSDSADSLLWSSVLEGLADLFAFYSENTSMKSLIGIQCLGYNRDINNGVFNDDQPKVLNTIAADALLSPSKHEATACGANFQDPHQVGAVIAYSLHRLIRKVVTTASGQNADSMVANDINVSYAMAMDWLQEFSTTKLNLKTDAKTSAELFQPLATSFEAVARK